jgi:hypothetical protein
MTARRWGHLPHETASRTIRQLLGRPTGKPRGRLGALLSSDDFGSSVEREAAGQVLWQVHLPGGYGGSSAVVDMH